MGIPEEASCLLYTSPLGKAVLGRKAGDRVKVETDDGAAYTVVIRSITKEMDDGNGTIL